nr:hypothetical protein [Microbacterium barkeri]
MSHIIITGASASGKSTVIRESIVPAYRDTHDIVLVPTGSTANHVLTKATPVSADRPTLVIIDEVRRPNIARAVEGLLDLADPAKVMVVVAAEPGSIRTNPGAVLNLHLTREHFIVRDAAMPAAA